MDEVARRHLELANTAALQGELDSLTHHLFASGMLTGIHNRVSWKYAGKLTRDDVNDVVSEGVGILYRHIRDGKVVKNIAGYITAICKRLAYDYAEANWAVPFSDVPAESLARMAVAEDDDDEYLRDRASKLLAAIQKAKSLVESISPSSAREIMRYVIELIEAGISHVSIDEIAEATGYARSTVKNGLSIGWRRLERLAVEDGNLKHTIDLSGYDYGEAEDVDN